MKKVWKPVVGYEGLYEVNQFGCIRSINRRWSGLILKQQEKRNGYMYVSLFKNGYKTLTVHNIVAHAFPEICGEWFECAEVNHKDENPKNNRADNLEWCTHTYNINFGTRNKKVSEKMKGRVLSEETKNKLRGKIGKRGGDSPKARKVAQFDVNGNYIQTFDSISMAKIAIGDTNAHITNVCKGQLKTTAGFIWRYV